MQTFKEIIEYVKVTYPELGDMGRMRLCMRIAHDQAIDAAAESAMLTEDYKDTSLRPDFVLKEGQQQIYGDGRDGNVWVSIDMESILKLKNKLL